MRSPFVDFLVPVFLVVCACLPVHTQDFTRTRTEKVLHAFAHDAEASVVAVSPDNRRVACLVKEKDANQLVVDGTSHVLRGKDFDEQLQGCGFSPDSTVLVYRDCGPDGDALVIGGHIGKRYSAVSGPVFSPTGHRVAYVAGRGASDLSILDDKSIENVADPLRGKQVLVADGQEGKKYDHIYRVSFSSDGSHLGYEVIDKQGEERKMWCIVGGKEYPRADYISSLSFAKDGLRFAYVAVNRRPADDVQQTTVVVSDGTPPKVYPDIQRSSLTFSPDGKRLGYVARSEHGMEIMVIDGKEELHRRMPRLGPVFSPDSKHVAYLFSDDPKEVALSVDGKTRATARFESAGADVDPWYRPTFSPNSLRIVCVFETAGGDEKRRVVVDGKQCFSCYRVHASPTFSPDSKRIAFVAEDDTTSCVVVADGQEGKRYDWINTIEDWSSDRPPVGTWFSPDSKYLVYVAGSNDKEGEGGEFVVVNGQEGKHYDQVMLGKDGIVFDGPAKFRYVARMGDRILMVEETLQDAEKLIPGTRN